MFSRCQVAGDKRTRCLRWCQTKNTFYLRHAAAVREEGGSVFDCFCSRNCSWPNLTVSVLGTVLGPIHTTLLGLFHPRTPQPLWNRGGIDRRKLKACLEFTTISRDSRGPVSHQQEYNFLPRPSLFSFHGQVFFWLMSIVSPSTCRLIEIHRHGLGNFSAGSNKTQRMDHSWRGRAYSEMDCLLLTGMGGVKCATIRFTHSIRRPLRSCRRPKTASKKPKGGRIVAPWDWGSQKIAVERLI